MPIEKLPKNGEKVEILVDGKWIKATFNCANSRYGDDWWMDYFELDQEDYVTVPRRTQSGDKLPEWRKLCQ